MNVATAAAKLTPTADSAIMRTACLPRRRPKTPFTNAPRSGMRRTTAMSEKSFCANKSRKGFISVFEEVGFVGPNGATDAEEGENNREADSDLGRFGRDDEEREHLTGVRGVVRGQAVERDEGEVHGVE